MINHVWSVPCTNHLINRDTNNLSLIECLESFTVQGPPELATTERVLPLSVKIVSFWTRQADQQTKGAARISLLNPAGEVLTVNQYAIDLIQFPRFRGIANIIGLPLQGPGTYHFRVELQEEEEGSWKEVALLPLEIQLKATDQQPPR